MRATKTNYPIKFRHERCPIPTKSFIKNADTLSKLMGGVWVLHKRKQTWNSKMHAAHVQTFLVLPRQCGPLLTWRRSKFHTARRILRWSQGQPPVCKLYTFPSLWVWLSPVNGAGHYMIRLHYVKKMKRILQLQLRSQINWFLVSQKECSLVWVWFKVRVHEGSLGLASGHGHCLVILYCYSKVSKTEWLVNNRTYSLQFWRL